MPASKKRIQNRGTLNVGTQQTPTALKDWVHIWHGVKVNNGLKNTSIFHAGSRIEEMPFWKQFIRLPSNSLFPRVSASFNPRKPYKDFHIRHVLYLWRTNTFFEAFNLSYQTFTTIGFGVVHPTKTCGNVSMSVESFASMMVVSTLTGLVFAKFAKPQAKVAFSKVCVVQPYGKKYLALVVRVANATQSRDVTHDVIMEAAFKVNLLRVERKTKQICIPDDEVTLERRLSQSANRAPVTPNGDNVVNDPACSTKVLTSYNLKLLQDNFITFRMGVAVVHLIDESSPLYGMSKTDIAQSDMLVEVAMTGVDSTLQDTVSERHIYTAANLMWGYRFAELIKFNERNAEVIMNFAKLSIVDSAPIDDARYLKSLLSRSVPRVSPKAEGNECTHDVAHRCSHQKLGLSSDQEDKYFYHVEAIREALSEDCEHLRLSLRSVSWEGQSSAADDDTPAFPHPLVSFLQKTEPQKFATGRESLFEPLLQQPFGTQRIPKTPSTGKRAAQRGGLRNWKENELEIGRAERSGEQLTLSDDANVCALYGSGAAHNSDVVRDSCEGPHGFRSKKWLQQEMVSASLSKGRPLCQSKLKTRLASYAFCPSTSQSLSALCGFTESALHVRWPKIVLVFVLSFLVINFSFGLLYWFDSDHIAVYSEMSVSKYELAFYMSVHTLATVGYGSIAPMPHSVYMNVVVFIESMIGIITVTIITGIAWSKFARPRAHIYFSSKMTISTIYGHRCLAFRAANTRHSGEVHENFFRIGVILTNRRTGLRQMYDVPLLTAEWPSIKLPVTLVHVINENSPFHKFRSMKDLSQSRVAVIALLTGFDTTFSENVYARKMYFWDDFAYDMRFDDCAVIERDCVNVDYERFDRLIQEDRDEQVITTPVLS
ncbi:unnamed protein product [Peronospora destructor]|uniref:Inward rectifier potassium channel C-terminal domain-containing protein n=1 Tax=Peronospora destructor TaxID=86335 RepID=A0AAV0U0K7_9STRA|nr:unnamed protein product [Peronospora destructor]